MPRSSKREAAGLPRQAAAADARRTSSKAQSAPRPPPSHGMAADGPPAAVASGRLSETTPAAGRSGSATGPHRPLTALEDVMQANHTAMERLRDGRVAESHAILTGALLQAEEEVRRLQGPSAGRPPAKRGARASRSPPPAHGAHTAREEAWFVCYATTLSNLGCQLRHEGKNEEALACLRDARDVEATLSGGRPSCSTMLNLSAVQLSLGDTEGALPIARDCVEAAQEGDRMLFITALHNLAVTLGQQPRDRERSAALPAMLRALREAQDFLGNDHPTTRMLSGKCAASHEWVLTQKPNRGAKGEGEAVPAAGAPRRGSELRTKVPAPPIMAPKLAVGRASLSAPGSTAKKPPVNLEPLTSASADAPTAPAPALSTPLSATPPIPTHTPAVAAADPSGSHESDPRRSVLSLSTEEPNVGQSLAATVAGPNAATAMENAREEPTGAGASATGTAVPAASHVEGQPLVCVRCPSVELRWAHSDSSSTAGEHEVALHESEPMPSRPVSAELSVADGRPHTTGYYVNVYGSDLPLYMRFAAVEDLRALAEAPAKDVFLTYRLVRERLRRHKAATAAGTAHTVPAAVVNAEPLAQTGASGLDGAARPAVPGAPPSARARRRERLEQEAREEEAYRRRRAAANAAAESAAAFARALAAIVARTQERAARRLQAVWRDWWARVGRPRQEVQRRRAEERERRLGERLAALALSTREEHARGRRRRPDGERDRALGRPAAPAVVVRCGLRWLERTTAVRYLARHRRPARAVTSAGAGAGGRQTAPPRITEAQAQRAVTRIQALWRGVRVRERCRRAREDAEVLAARERAREEAMAVEAQAYAAIVIQCCARRFLARRARAARFAEVHHSATVTLQRWFRETLEEQRRRGVDGPTQRRHEAAARTIQCAYRCFCARLALHQRRIRKHMDYLRLLDRDARLLTAGPAAETVPTPALAPAAPVAEVESSVPVTETVTGSSDKTAEVRARVAAQAAARAYEVLRAQEADYERFDVPLFHEPAAARARAAAMERVSLRPFLVTRRRAAEDLRTEEEVLVGRRERAATKIQRAFRSWLRHRDNPNRDRTLLRISRGRYQQAALARQVEKKRWRCQQERAQRLFGDSAAQVRSAVVDARRELAQARTEAGDTLPGRGGDTGRAPVALPSSSPLLCTDAGHGEREVAEVAGRPTVAGIRSCEQRLHDEMSVRADEQRVASTYPRDLARLRSGR